jgi:hypothetical protein
MIDSNSANTLKKNATQQLALDKKIIMLILEGAGKNSLKKKARH